MGGNCFSSTSDTEMNAPVIISSTTKHSATVIFMHGLGDTGHGWAEVMKSIRANHVKYVCPTAPVMPVTLNNGFRMPSWFDIKSLSVNADQDEAGIESAKQNVHQWIEDEIKLGIPSNRIMLGGFSQGGALALYSAFLYDKPLAGIIGLSCFLPMHEKIHLENSVNKNIPILQCHGDADPLVVPMIGQLTAGFLKKHNPAHHTYKTYANLAHSSCDEELLDMKNFIAEVLPPV